VDEERKELEESLTEEFEELDINGFLLLKRVCGGGLNFRVKVGILVLLVFIHFPSIIV
jgi:hypothetical protein